MKNILIFISPTESFDNPRPDIINDAGVTVKVQIDNSLMLGWKKEDIWLFTNFPYEYGGIKATVLDNVDFFERKPQASKINAIIKLFENGTIKDDEIYWFHDLDAFQIATNDEIEIDLKTADMALTDYGRNDRWSAGVIYFKKSSRDIFESIRDVMYKKNIDEERALTHLTRNNEEINKRVEKINKSYNFTPRNFKTMYPLVIKPIRVAHFHPLGAIGRLDSRRSYHFFQGKNSLNQSILPEDLISIFTKHNVL